jgi:Ran GTPase-activating protein (RanGAP) involved in mRNA processing and transport
MNDASAVFLSQMIYKNRSIVQLHLGSNDFTEQSAGFFGVALATNRVIQELDFSRNALRFPGFWALSVSLSDTKSIRSLDIRHNRIGQDAGQCLCNLIEQNSALTIMKLSGNPLGDAVIEQLACTLGINITIREIELNDVEMTSRGFAALCRELSKNQKVEKFSVNGNRLSGGVMAEFESLLRANDTLLSVWLESCNIDDSGCAFIGEGLQMNLSVREISFCFNPMTLPGINAIMEAITGNFSLIMVGWTPRPPLPEEDSRSVTGPMQGFLERNRYCSRSMVMRDMAQLLVDVALWKE